MTEWSRAPVALVVGPGLIPSIHMELTPTQLQEIQCSLLISVHTHMGISVHTHTERTKTCSQNPHTYEVKK